MKIKRIDLLPMTPPANALPVLDRRLLAAVAYLRGERLADVGTDHAYLPLCLLRQGKCPFAVATDIHEGPAEIAAANLAGAGIGNDRAAVLRTDGLHGAEVFAPRDICVLGMGGETIIHVLAEAPFVRTEGVRLVLQPMTHPELLRNWLSREGFAIVGEMLVEEGKLYQVLCAEYDGVVRTLTPLEALAGKRNLTEKPSLLLPLLTQIRASCQTALAGKRHAGSDTTAEEALLGELAPYFENGEE